MRILILITEKKMLACSPEQWTAAKGAEMIVFTGFGKKKSAETIRAEYDSVFERLYLFDNFEYNDLVELEAVKCYAQKPFEQVLCFSEINILRSARIREKLGLPGQKPSEAIFYRNKFKMKQLAQANGVKCPRFAKVRNAMELQTFIDQVGYPVVLKPLEGRGSWETNVFKNEAALHRFLDQGGLSKTHRMPDLLAEEFIGGQMYMVDCLFIEGEESFYSVAHLPTRPIEFLNGGYGSIYRLRRKHPKFEQIRTFANRLILEVFPRLETSIFQVELFDYQGELYLCEIACRMGGVAFNEEVKLTYGFDLKLQYIDAMRGEGRAAIGAPSKMENKCIGWLVFPPQEGELVAIKADPQNIDDLLAFQLPGIENYQTYAPAQLTNCEVATFIFEAADEEKAQHKIEEIAQWVHQNLEWNTAVLK